MLSNNKCLKLKAFADNNFKFDEKVQTFYKRLENIMGKEDIACYVQMYLFSQCSQRTCTADLKKHRFTWERVDYPFHLSK